MKNLQSDSCSTMGGVGEIVDTYLYVQIIKYV